MSVNNTKTGWAQYLQFFHLSQSTLPRDTPHPTHHRPLLLLMVLCMFCQQLGMFDTFAASVSEATMKYIYVQNNSTIDDSWIGTPISKKTSTPSQKNLKPISSVADIQNIPQNTDTLLISDGSWILPGKVKKPVTNTPTEVTLNAAPNQELSYSNNANIITNGILPLPANYVTPNGTSYYAIPGNTGPQSSSTSGDANIGGNTNVGGSVSVGGNLSVSGTTTLKSTNTPAVNVLGQDTNGTVTQVTLGSGINLSGGVLSVDAGWLTQNISASWITAENIVVQTGSISSLSSQTGTITNLFSDMITAVKGVFDEIVTNILRARTAVIENIFSKNISTENLTATGVVNFNMANFSGNVTFNNLPSIPLSHGALMVGNTGNKASELTAGSGGQVLVILNGTPVWTDAATVAPVISVFGRTGAVIAKTGDYNTSQVTESGSLYFTNTRARASISATGVVTYDSVNGIIGWNGTTDNVPEGWTNLYYTESRFSGSLATQKNTANGVAGLDANAKVSIMNLPGITMNSVWTAISQADCTTKTLATRGDICIATSDSKSYILSTTHYETQSDWQELLNPTAPVSQVNGQVGNINFIGTNGVTVSGTTISLTNIGTGGLYGSATKIPVITTDTQGRVTNVTETTIPTATAGQLGLLSPSDYVRFDAKQDFIWTGTTAQYYRGDKTWATLDTSVVGENGNLYFTVSRVRSALSATGGISYNSTTGVFSDIFSFTNGLSRNGNSISISTITGAQLSGFTSGRLTFGTASGGLTQSNNLFWDNVNGRLGIGTMTPNSALNIVGDMEVTGKILNHGFDFVLGDGDQVSRGDSGYSRALVKNSGNRLSLNFNGDFAGGTTMGALFSQASGTGNIGIGTQNPGEKLEVIGNMKVSGGYLFGNNSYMGGDNGGNIELGGNNLTAWVGTPYIDFHYSGVTSDYNARIINSSSGRLDLIANTLYTNTKLGIGASAPTDALQVVGASRVGTAESYLRTYFDGSNIRIENTGTGNIVMNYLNGKSVDIKNLLTSYLSVSGDINQRDANGNGFIMHARGGNGYDFWQLAPSNSGTYDWSKGITLNRASGNVGIGNNAPNEKFSVFWNASFSNYTGWIIIYPGEFPSIAARNWANTVIGQMIFDTTNKKTLIDFDGGGGGDFSIRKVLNSNTDTVFRITSWGNVGIGTTTPSATLSVSGSFLLANGTQGVGKILTSDASGLATWSSLTGGLLSGFTAGQLTFGSASGGLIQSNNLFWDNTKLTVGTADNLNTVKFTVNGAIQWNANWGGLLLIDGTGNQIFRWLRSPYGTWNTISTYFQLGGANWIFTGINGSKLTRFGTLTDSFQISNGTNVNTPDPVGLFEVTTATTKLFNILSSGNVGIGTTTPSTKLEINSGIAGSGGLRFTNLLSSSASNGQFSGILGVNSAGDVGLAQLTGNSFTGFTNGQLAFGIASGGLSSTGWLFWDNTNGRLGIGTNAPQSWFHFVSTSTIPGFRISGRAIDNSNDTSGGVIFWMMHNDNSWNRQMVFWRTDDIGSSSNGFVRFIWGAVPSLDAVTGNGGTRLKIQLWVAGDPNSWVYSADLGVNGKVGIGSTYYNSSTLPVNGLAVQGNVGIGTTSPSAKLEIDSGVANSAGLRFTRISGSGTGLYAGTASWNVTRAIGINSSGDVYITNWLGSLDSRSVDYTPSDRPAWLYVDFKNNTTNWLNDGGVYNGVMTFRSYGFGTDLTGGYPMQLSYTANGNLYTRLGTWTTTWENWRKVIVENSAGNVGIGTNSPSYKLHVNGTAAGTSWTNTSDERFKTNISNISSGLDVINALRSVSYNWNALGKEHGGDIDKRQYGFIAQEVESLLPEIVNTDSEGYKSIDYIKIIPFLTKALQELAQNTASTGALSTLSGQVASLAVDMTSLSGQVAILSQNTGSTVVNNYYNDSTTVVQTGTNNTGELIDLADMVATLSGSIASQSTTIEQLQTQVDVISRSIFSGSSYDSMILWSNDLTPLVWTHSGAILTDLEASTAEPRNVLSYITHLFSRAIDVVRDFVALEITALRGYFDQIWAEQVTTDELTATDADIGTLHTDKICMKRSNGSEICINWDQLADMMNTPVAPTTSTPVTPVSPTEPITNSGSSTEDTITEPTTNSDPTIIADPPVTDATTVITPEAPVVDTESTDTDIVTP